MHRHVSAFALCLAFLAVASLVAAEPAPGNANLPIGTSAEANAVTLEKNSPAVVRVSATLNLEVSMAGAGAQKQEKRQEITGTVLDASGLTVVSLMVLDPSDMMQELMDLAPTKSKVSYKVAVTDLKICLPDGKEIPARLVFKDPDLDLAFLLPEKVPGEALPAFAAVPNAPAREANVLDNLLTVTRLDKAMHRAPGAKLFEVIAVLRKPRTAYMCANEGHTPSQADPTILLGSPAFTSDGGFAGVWTMGKSALLGAPARGEMPTPEPVVLPADAVLNSAKQARAAKQQPATQDAATTQTK
jgi:hypothetical protein